MILSAVQIRADPIDGIHDATSVRVGERSLTARRPLRPPSRELPGSPTTISMPGTLIASGGVGITDD